MQPKLSPTELYVGDNGRCFCGAHAGCSAMYTGRDLSGHNVMRVTERMALREGVTLSCEATGCGVVRGAK